MDGTTVGSFDTNSGDYYFQSTDIVNFIPGTYTFEITGTVGSKSDSATWSMTLEDPCPDAIFFLKQNPFTNDTYYLRDPQIEKLWVLDDLVEVFTQVDCGTISTQFYYEDTTPYDTLRFNDLRAAPNSF